MEAGRALPPVFLNPLFSHVAVFLPFRELFHIISLVCPAWSRIVFNFSRVRLECRTSAQAMVILQRLNLSSVTVVEIHAPTGRLTEAILKQFPNAKCMCLASIGDVDLSGCDMLEYLFSFGEGQPTGLPQSLEGYAQREALRYDDLALLPNLRQLCGVTDLYAYDAYEAANKAMKLNLDSGCFAVTHNQVNIYPKEWTFNLRFGFEVPLSYYSDQFINSIREVSLTITRGMAGNVADLGACSNLKRLFLVNGEETFERPNRPVLWPKLEEVALCNTSLTVLHLFEHAEKLTSLQFERYLDDHSEMEMPSLPQASHLRFNECSSGFINSKQFSNVTWVTISYCEFMLPVKLFNPVNNLHNMQLCRSVQRVELLFPSWNKIDVQTFQDFLNRHAFTNAVCDIALEFKQTALHLDDNSTPTLHLDDNLTLTLPRRLENKLVCRGHVHFADWPEAHKAVKAFGYDKVLLDFEICAKRYL